MNIKVFCTGNLFLFLITMTLPSLATNDDTLDLSLDYLLSMDVIETITKNPEPLFEAPLGVSILTRDEILASGATSIPEALRLMPGLLVREQTPGVYDIHIRGFDNVVASTLLPFAQNALTLVMIDYRVVFNYFSGGTFWETFPVGIHDIHQIELIRGASSALYGPNAVTGVINIVTRKSEMGKQGISANIDYGNRDDVTVRAAYDFEINNQLKGIFSANARDIHREESLYYTWNTRDYQELSSLSSVLAPDEQLDQLNRRYENPDNSLSNLGINAMLQYKNADDREINLRFGYQDSTVQKVGVNNFATPFTTNESDTYYANISLKEGSWLAQINYSAGDQETLGMSEWQYKFDVFDISVERTWTVGDLSIRPALSYQTATYEGDFIGGSQKLTDASFSVFPDYRINDKLRLIGALRVDDYNNPDDPYTSYQLSLAYLPQQKSFFRLSVFRANRSSFFVDSFLDVDLVFDDAVIAYNGNTNTDLMTVDSIEASFRYKPTAKFLLDFEVFYAQLTDFTNLNLQDVTNENGLLISYAFRNYDLEGKQFGASFDLDLQFGSNINARIFGNYQDTEFSGENGGQLSPIFFVDSNSGPSFFGGADFAWKTSEKISLHANCYYMDSQDFAGILERTTLDSKTNLNLRLAYRPMDKLSLSLNARGLLGDDQLEYGFADPIGEQYFVNLRYSH